MRARDKITRENITPE